MSQDDAASPYATRTFALGPHPLAENEITFGAGIRDRADRLRANPMMLGRLVADSAARALPVWRGKPLVAFDGPRPRLGCLPLDHPLVAHAAEPPVFLGLEGEGRATSGRYAADVSPWVDPEFPDGPPKGFFDPTRNSVPGLPESLQFVELRAVMAQLSAEEAGDAATARGVLEWHRTHPFCSRCGAKSAPDGAGWKRLCPSCGAHHFPRTDPVVIMLVTHGDRALVGRQAMWPRGMYSLLAGFMEPGETMEGATRREVSEEAGVPVGRVRYLASQPWPFPASLMIGCAAEALDDRITLDEVELQEAFWVTREDMREAIAGRHPKIGPARPGAIARSVLEAWAEGRIPDWD